MTPDEVVGVLKVFQAGWVPYTKGAKYPVEHQALTTAIALIQDYQKLRERVSVEKIENIIPSNALVLDNSVTDCPMWLIDKQRVAQAIITYLQQPTEH